MLKKILSLLNYPSTAVLSAPGVSAAFARTLTDKNNPDHIILAHILQSFATEFDKWEHKAMHYHRKKWDYDGDKEVPATWRDAKWETCIEAITFTKPCSLTLKKEGLKVSVLLQGNRAASDFKVNETPVNPNLAISLFLSYNELKKKKEAIEALAAAAKAEMEANEKKWELAESLLGMKRDSTGCLSAIKCLACEATDDCDDHCDGVIRS